MIERVNFLSKGLFGLDYLKMIKITGVCFIGFLTLTCLQNFRLGRAEGKLKNIQSQIQEIKTKRIPGHAGGTTGGADPLRAISNAMLRELPWPEVLLAISDSLTDGIWLEKVAGESSKDGNQVLIEGTAIQQYLIPSFLNRLRNWETFERVQLLSTKIFKDGKTRYRFTVKGTIQNS